MSSETLKKGIKMVMLQVEYGSGKYAVGETYSECAVNLLLMGEKLGTNAIARCESTGGVAWPKTGASWPIGSWLKRGKGDKK